MVENLLVTNFFTAGMIEAGRKLLQALDQAGVEIDAAFWLYFSEAEEWRLILSGPEADMAGPRALLEEIFRILNTLPETDRIPFGMLAVRTKDDPILKVLRNQKSVGPSQPGIRLTRTAVGGTYIEDAYVYRLPSAARRRRS